MHKQNLQSSQSGAMFLMQSRAMLLQLHMFTPDPEGTFNIFPVETMTSDFKEELTFISFTCRFRIHFQISPPLPDSLSLCKSCFFWSVSFSSVWNINSFWCPLVFQSFVIYVSLWQISPSFLQQNFPHSNFSLVLLSTITCLFVLALNVTTQLTGNNPNVSQSQSIYLPGGVA